MDAWEILIRFDITDSERSKYLTIHLSSAHHIHVIEAAPDIYEVISKFHQKIHTCPEEVFQEALRQAREESNGNG